MEKNTTKYFLGIVLLSIWGLLGYRVYNKMRPKNDWKPVAQTIVLDNNQIKQDSFTLLLNYNNPFQVNKNIRMPQAVLADNSDSKQNLPQQQYVSKKQRVQNALKKKKTEPVPFPMVSYKGNIKLKNGRTVALVNIDNQIMNLGKGEEHGKVLLRKIYSDSIQVRFEGRDSVIMKAR